MAVAAQTRPRPGGGRLFIIVGAALAALSFVLVFVVGGVLTGGHGPGGATVPVVVAARDIPLRAPLTKEDLKLVDFAQSDAPPKAYSKVDDIVKNGLIAELNIAKGQPLTENMLARTGDTVVGAQPAYLPIPQGFVAITIPTNEQQGVAGYIQPGDYINVIATAATTLFQQNTSQPKNVSVTVFTNLHVLRLGPSSGTVQPAGGTGQPQTGTQGGVASSITVVTTQCDAQYLNWLLTYTQVKYTLSSYKDYQPQDTKVDANCPNANAATQRQLSPQQVDSRYGFTKV